MDSCICSEGIRFLEAAQSPRAQSPRAQSRDEARTSDGDDDLAAGAAVSEVADRLGNFVERECPVDDGCDRAGFEQPPQLLQVLLALLRDEGAELLLDERRERGRPELTADTEPVAVLSADDHERPPRRKRLPQV